MSSPMKIRREFILEVDCPLLDTDTQTIEWLLGGSAPLCYPDSAKTDPHLRAVILAYDGGEGPHAPLHDPRDPREAPDQLWDFVCQVAAEAGLADEFCYVRLNPTSE